MITRIIFVHEISDTKSINYIIYDYDYDRYPMANKVTSKELLERKDQYVSVDVREADELGEGMIY
jgi:hypothetical protein